VAGGFGTNFNCFGNIVVNNIFAYGKEYQLTVYGDAPSGAPQPKGEVFARNIVLWKDGPLIKESDWPAFSTLWDYNLYWQEEGKPVEFMKYSLDQWRGLGLDSHSLVADPMFVDAAQRNFALRPESPALSLGFRPIDLRTVGPREECLEKGDGDGTPVTAVFMVREGDSNGPLLAGATVELLWMRAADSEAVPVGRAVSDAGGQASIGLMLDRQQQTEGHWIAVLQTSAGMINSALPGFPKFTRWNLHGPRASASSMTPRPHASPLQVPTPAIRPSPQ
jgi:hypothetical protein